MPGRKITRKIRYVESDNSMYEYIWSAEDSTSYASTTNFYLTYNNVNYYFSKPNGISVGGKFKFNTSTKVLKYNNTTISTSSTGSGATLLNFVASHKWSNEYINIGANAENVICSDGKTVEEKLGGLGGNYVDKAGDVMTGGLTTTDLAVGSRAENKTIGINSVAEGYSIEASGNYSHAEGYKTIASGDYSHAEGRETQTYGGAQHVEGVYNIIDTQANTATGNNYVHIIGNGNNTTKSNAHTLDWSGNAWFAGDVYTGSTSGTNKDAGSKKLATEEYVETNGGKIDSISIDGRAQTIDANKNVNLTGLEKTINKVTSLSSSSTDSQYPSAKAVYDTIEALPEPMVFKGSVGTGGTVTILPTTGSADIGDTYKVITNGTYAGKAAKIGDTFICLTKTSNSNTWELIPSGDEPSGTVTSITLKATSPISIDSSSAITTSGTRTLSHANSGVTAGTYKSVTVNATGHITAGTNPTTIDGYGITDVAIRKYDSDLILTDNSTPTLQNNTFYFIKGLSVNGVSDVDFSWSIIFFWQVGGNTYIDLITKYTNCGIYSFGKRYAQIDGVWTVQDQNQYVTSINSSSTNKEFPSAKAVYDFVPNITYSTTDLIAGSSALETGKFYFVYE